jgi:hypothetical protein
MFVTVAAEMRCPQILHFKIPSACVHGEGPRGPSGASKDWSYLNLFSSGKYNFLVEHPASLLNYIFLLSVWKQPIRAALVFCSFVYMAFFPQSSCESWLKTQRFLPRFLSSLSPSQENNSTSLIIRMMRMSVELRMPKRCSCHTGNI